MSLVESQYEVPWEGLESVCCLGQTSSRQEVQGSREQSKGGLFLSTVMWASHVACIISFTPNKAKRKCQKKFAYAENISVWRCLSAYLTMATGIYQPWTAAHQSSNCPWKLLNLRSWFPLFLSDSTWRSLYPTQIWTSGFGFASSRESNYKKRPKRYLESKSLQVEWTSLCIDL